MEGGVEGGALVWRPPVAPFAPQEYLPLSAPPLPSLYHPSFYAPPAGAPPPQPLSAAPGAPLLRRAKLAAVGEGGVSAALLTLLLGGGALLALARCCRLGSARLLGWRGGGRRGTRVGSLVIYEEEVLDTSTTCPRHATRPAGHLRGGGARDGLERDRRPLGETRPQARGRQEAADVAVVRDVSTTCPPARRVAAKRLLTSHAALARREVRALVVLISQ